MFPWQQKLAILAKEEAWEVGGTGSGTALGHLSILAGGPG